MPKYRLKPNKIILAMAFAFPVLGIASPIACEISPLAKLITKPLENASKSVVKAVADEGELTPTEGRLLGNAQFFYGNDELLSEGFHLNRIDQVVTSTGENVTYATPNAVLQGREGTYLLDQNEVFFNDTQYYLVAEPNIQGRASHIDHNERTRISIMENATYSTCSIDNEVWKVKSNNIEVDHNVGRAKAHNATLDIFGVPLLYTPYISLPIDGKRHSGLLTPEIGVSKSDGFIFFLPYYFNIAPNMDAILAPGIIQKRGLAVKGNFRYLNEWQTLELDGTYLFKDRLYDDKKRWIFKYQQDLKFTKNFTGSILYNAISDDHFQEDVNDQSGLLREITLDRNAELNYRTENWTAKLRLQDFVVTDREIIPNNPYGRAPQLLFKGNWNLEGFDVGIDAEFVQFRAKDNHLLDKRKPHKATRIDIMPHVGIRLENSWGYIEPIARFRYTHYNLSYKNEKYNKGKETSISRTLPIFSLRTGMFFEKNIEFDKLFGGGEFVQTIEPELYYLYAPYRKQSNIPIFDTSNASNNFYNLFTYNAFYGADRQSNANQITAALTSRIFDTKTGIEKFNLSLGQTQYFENPRITLGDDLDEGREKVRHSDLNAKLGFDIISDLRFESSVQWSPSTKRVSYGNIDLKYRPEPRKMFTISYRYDRWSVDTKNDYIDASAFWQLNNKWAIAGRYNYALSESKMIESIIGFEYQDCCVTTRVAARYYRNNVNDNNKQWRLYLEFELDGMGSFGQNTQQLWRNNISGFTPKRNRYF